MLQKTVHEYIAESEAIERKTGGVGRPRGEPTRMTTVNMPPELHLPAPELCRVIEAWLDRVDIRELVKYAAQRALNTALNTGEHRPVAFTVEGLGIYEAKKAEARSQNSEESEAIKDFKKSFRIPVRLYKRLQDAAAQLGNHPSDVIRLARINAFPLGGRELLDRRMKVPTAIKKPRGKKS